MLSQRQEQILAKLVEKYIEQAEPVSSAVLADLLKVSSATVRNDMAQLEEKGYIFQPHTSAGRMPTIEGYAFYTSQVFTKKPLTTQQKTRLEKTLTAEHPLKSAAKEIAELSREAVIVAFDRHNTYYTGITYLFSQPEFADQSYLLNISGVIDRFDDAVQSLYEMAMTEPQILLGSKNPLSKDCAMIVGKTNESLLAIVGPIRMDYRKNMSLVEFILHSYK